VADETLVPSTDGTTLPPVAVETSLTTPVESPATSRSDVYLELPLQLSAPGCGDVAGYCVLGFAGFEMPITVNSWQEGMIEVQMPTMTFSGATDATLMLYHADRTLFAELPLTLHSAAQ
jgi:hypothetical protein